MFQSVPDDTAANALDPEIHITVVATGFDRVDDRQADVAEAQVYQPEPVVEAAPAIRELQTKSVPDDTAGTVLEPGLLGHVRRQLSLVAPPISGSKP